MRLVVYNLGYLPGGDHSVTTLSSTTLESLRNALPLVAEGGAVTVMCYPGHPAGREEGEQVISFLAGLNKPSWRVFAHRPIQNPEEKFLVVAMRRR